MTKYSLKEMKKNDYGRILLIASIAGKEVSVIHMHTLTHVHTPTHTHTHTRTHTHTHIHTHAHIHTHTHAVQMHTQPIANVLLAMESMGRSLLTHIQHKLHLHIPTHTVT